MEWRSSKGTQEAKEALEIITRHFEGDYNTVQLSLLLGVWMGLNERILENNEDSELPKKYSIEKGAECCRV